MKEAEAKKPEPTAFERLFTEDAPPWLQVHLAKLEGDPGRIELTAEQLASLDPAVQRMLAVLVKQSQAGRAQLEETQRKLKTDREEVEERGRAAQGAEANALQVFKHQLLKEFRESLKPKGDQPDPLSPEGLEWKVDQLLAEKLDAFFGTFDKVEQARAAEHQQAVKLAAHKARNAEIDTFFAATPDLQNPQILELVRKELEKYGIDETTLIKLEDGREVGFFRMRPEDAYEIVMSRLAAGKEKADREASLQRAREAVAPGGGHGRNRPALPKNWAAMSGEEKHELLQREPELRKALANGTARAS